MNKMNNRIISFIGGLVLIGIFKILDYFRIFRPIKPIIALLGFIAICYAIFPILSPILRLFGIGDGSKVESYTDWSAREKEKAQKEYEAEKNRLNNLKRTNQISEADYIYWMNELESKHRK